MDKEKRLGLRTWLTVDKGAIKANFKAFRGLIPKETLLMGVVKSNAYGHNIFDFARELQILGVDYLAVDSVVEGMALRREGIKIPILILGYTLPEMLQKAVENDLDITVSNFDYFAQLKKIKLNKVARVHIKVDSGMHRQGFQEGHIEKVIREIKKIKSTVTVVGLYTHFASAKNPKEREGTKKQIEVFNKWKKAFDKEGIKVLCHACATSGTLIFPEAHFDMVRIGIGLYGIWPSAEIKKSLEKKIKLKPVLSWKTIIGEINKIKKGESIGYDFTEKLKRDTQVAVLPIGYWHGFPRALSGIGQVLVRGQKAKVLGRVCMDIIMVDVTDIKKVRVGDEVTIIGRDGKEEITVDDIAGQLKGSAYELVTRINPLIKRIYQ